MTVWDTVRDSLDFITVYLIADCFTAVLRVALLPWSVSYTCIVNDMRRVNVTPSRQA
jgi:hypothetical protein